MSLVQRVIPVIRNSKQKKNLLQAEGNTCRGLAHHTPLPADSTISRIFFSRFTPLLIAAGLFFYSAAHLFSLSRRGGFPALTPANSK
jgi:hypothetical protein